MQDYETPMTRWTQHTISGIRGVVSPTILCALIFALVGCSSASHRQATMMPTRPSAVHPSVAASTSNEHVRSAADQELGAETAASIPIEEQPSPEIAEPGAAAIAHAILLATLEHAGPGSEPIQISLQELKNQSRCGAAEFDQFRQRFAEVLNRAAQSQRAPIRFIAADEKSIADYRVQGAAYLISRSGFDVWELFLSITPANQSWSVWQAPGPIRVLRHARPNQPQIIEW
jgi:hypothetical protein